MLGDAGGVGLGGAELDGGEEPGPQFLALGVEPVRDVLADRLQAGLGDLVALEGSIAGEVLELDEVAVSRVVRHQDLLGRLGFPGGLCRLGGFSRPDGPPR